MNRSPSRIDLGIPPVKKTGLGFYRSRTELKPSLIQNEMDRSPSRIDLGIPPVKKNWIGVLQSNRVNTNFNTEQNGLKSVSDRPRYPSCEKTGLGFYRSRTELIPSLIQNGMDRSPSRIDLGIPPVKKTGLGFLQESNRVKTEFNTERNGSIFRLGSISVFLL